MKINPILIDNTVILYNNNAGTSGNIQLSETSANFTYLEVFYKENGANSYSSTKIYNPNGKKISLFVVIQGSAGTNTQINSAVYTISGTTLTKAGNYGYGQLSNGTTSVASKTDRIVIERVIGYR